MGNGLLMLAVGVIAFSVYRSRKRLNTILFTLAAMTVGFGIPGLAALFKPGYAAAFGPNGWPSHGSVRYVCGLHPFRQISR
jgi:hypothetical protein